VGSAARKRKDTKQPRWRRGFGVELPGHVGIRLMAIQELSPH
jgi:hypothetical protein